jgi:hypothetical protein
MKYTTTATLLNLRRTPKIASTNIVGKLIQHTLVEKIEEHSKDWWKVKTTYSGKLIEGYVHSSYLKKVNQPVEEPLQEKADFKIPEVNLKSINNKATRSNQRWAFCLEENDLPFRNLGSLSSKTDSIHKIIDYLNVEKSLRYSPKTTSTYCNIYAYDYCYLCKVFIPRVWWSSKALLDISKGEKVDAVYAKTVYEQNANSLLDWLQTFGKDFGWVRSFELNEIQDAANKGKVVIICAAHKNANNSGHITAVVPENTAHKAIRNTLGNITQPLQSQAGRVNRKYFNQNWWLSSNYRDFGFWIHD